MLLLPVPDLLAVATGESIVAFVARGAVEQGDEVELAGSESRAADQLQRPYRHWTGRDAPAGPWTAVVEEVHPSAALDPVAGAARHVLARVPEGDVIVLRVLRNGEPVLSDVAHSARRRSLDAALAP